MKAIKYSLSILAMLAIIVVSCTDPEPEILAISKVEAVGTSFADGSAVTKDLNGASSAADVALNSTITITFDRAVDASTVNEANVSLSSNAGDVTAAVTSSGSTVTVDPNDDLTRGTSYTLNVSGLKSDEGGAFTATTRTFTTEGRAPVVVPNADKQIAYWNFDNQADDQVGSFNPDNIVAIAYGEDRFGQGGSTATFDGDESIIEIPGADALMASDDFTVSYWMKSNSNGHVNEDGDPAGYFVMGLGAFYGFQFEVRGALNEIGIATGYQLADGSTDSETLFFNGNGQDKDNGGWKGWDISVLLPDGGVQDLIADKWVQVLYSYNAAEQQGRLYLNGQIMKGFDFELWGEGTPKSTATGVTYRENADVESILALGFIKSIDSPLWADTPWGDYFKPTSNHFKGDLDDVRIFNTSFTPEEVETLYNSEK